MGDPTSFLTIMGALSTAVQTFVDHVVKGRWGWLNKPTPVANPRNEERRQSVVHLVSFLVGALIAYAVDFKPLLYLSPASSDYGLLANAVAAGVLVSFGSSFFNEALDAVRAFKKAQEGVRQAQVTGGVALPNVTS
jgi:hypothetical protein